MRRKFISVKPAPLARKSVSNGKVQGQKLGQMPTKEREECGTGSTVAPIAIH